MTTYIFLTTYGRIEIYLTTTDRIKIYFDLVKPHVNILDHI